MAHLRLPGFGASQLPAGDQPSVPTSADAELPPPFVPEVVPRAPDTQPPPMPYPPAPPPIIPSIPAVPAVARTWLQARPWVLPVGGGLLAFLLGLTIGAAMSRRRA